MSRPASPAANLMPSPTTYRIIPLPRSRRAARGMHPRRSARWATSLTGAASSDHYKQCEATEHQDIGRRLGDGVSERTNRAIAAFTAFSGFSRADSSGRSGQLSAGRHSPVTRLRLQQLRGAQRADHPKGGNPLHPLDSTVTTSRTWPQEQQLPRAMGAPQRGAAIHRSRGSASPTVPGLWVSQGESPLLPPRLQRHETWSEEQRLLRAMGAAMTRPQRRHLRPT